MNDQMKKTALFDYHNLNSKNIISFSGYALPVFYKSILDEHHAVRKSAGLFDVSHMGQIIVSGASAEKFIQTVTTNDVSKIMSGQAQYSAICNNDGCIIDDIIIYKLRNGFMLVVNASGIEEKYNWLKSKLFDRVSIENKSSDFSMIALQGPKSKRIIQSIINNEITKLKFYSFIENMDCLGHDILLSRTGYTGELGFEIYCKHDAVKTIWNYILENFGKDGVLAAGLGARDTLRLEMGYLLYGNDINIDTHPFKAGLGWITSLEKGDFIGRKEIILKRDDEESKLVYFEMLEKSIPRPGFDIIVNDKVVGFVTSGTISPSLNKGIGIAYVNKSHTKKGTELSVKIRNKLKSAVVVKAPFYSNGTLSN
tara:strand:+ start:1316 stop:2419 length:1104 start_codon:yes stop_codon:yes gene_type:complete